VTPLSPTDWKLIYDGKSVTLDPSFGNWSFACKSHYWIRGGKVRWAGAWSQEEIDAGRANDRLAKERYFQSASAAPAGSRKKQGRRLTKVYIVENKYIGHSVENQLWSVEKKHKCGYSVENY
jgi:hypothetical protein